jgi:chloramphenicol O-acetyltransferase
MSDFYYEITDNGYHIFDRNDETFHVHQYEPYIPDKTKSYEENAKAQIEEIKASSAAAPVQSDDDLTGVVTWDALAAAYTKGVNEA